MIENVWKFKDKHMSNLRGKRKTFREDMKALHKVNTYDAKTLSRSPEALKWLKST